LILTIDTVYNTFMKKTLKRLSIYFFAFFVFVLFSSLAVFLIIIAQGGKVTRDGIERTGIVKINVEPERDIKVYLDDKIVTLKDKKIENLTEGEYTIRVEKDGFTTWTKEVKVETGIVKEVFATLFPIEYELNQITQTSIDRAFFSIDGSFVVYPVRGLDENDNGIWKYKLTSNAFGLISNRPEKIYNLTPFLDDLLQKEYELTISYDNSRFLITTDSSQSIFSMNGGDNNVIQLEDIENIGFLSDRIEWFKKGNSLIIEKDKTIYEYNISDNSLRFIYKFEETPIYAVNGQNLVFFAQEKYYTYNNGQKRQLNTVIKSTLPVPESLWMSSNNENILYVSSEDMLYYVDTTKSIHYIGEYTLENISPNGESAIIQDEDNDVFVFRSQYMPGKDSINTEIKPLNMKNQDKTSFKWSVNGLHIIVNHRTEAVSNLKLMDAYVANEYNLIESEQIIEDCYQYLPASSEFMLLLRDSVNSTEANLYRIVLK